MADVDVNFVFSVKAIFKGSEPMNPIGFYNSEIIGARTWSFFQNREFDIFGAVVIKVFGDSKVFLIFDACHVIVDSEIDAGGG